MAAYKISYYLYRSNPIIWREIKIPSECTVQDLIAAFCLAMGISPVQGKMWDEDEQLLSEKTVLKDLFETEGFLRLTTGRCEIIQEKNRQEMNSLTFFYEVLDTLEENLSAPEVLDGTLFHLPQNVFRVGIINEILNGLENQESYTLAAIGPFYRGQQYFNKKKTHNLLYSWFLPEKAIMLKTEYAVPLPTVLEKKTLNELKSLADVHHVYVYNHRKADYIAALDDKLCRFDPYYILKQMHIREYRSFRELVLRGEIASRDIDELYDIFPVLFHYGMICFTKKQGVFLASAIMQEYEDWYDQEKEIQFRREKLLASVMNGCRIYYGAFTKSICKTVLNTLYPDEISDEVLDRMWGEKMMGAELPDLLFKNYADGKEVIACERSLFNEKEEPIYLKVLSEDDTPRFIPDKKTFEAVSQNGIKSVIPAYRELSMFMRPYLYGAHESEELSTQAINCLRKGFSVSETSKLIVNRFHYVWRGREVIQKELEVVLEKIFPDIPNIHLYGYTATAAVEQNITSKAKTEVKRLIKAMEEEEQARKKAAAARKAAVKKTRATKTTGKRGRWS